MIIMQPANRKVRILFLCTGNSCRSQMAEGWARKLKSGIVEAYSAGVEPKPVDPRAVRAMAEVGVDISEYRAKDVTEFNNVEFDYVITLCDHARETCPLFLGAAKQVHQGFEDPKKLAENAESEEDAMRHYRRIRDELKAYVDTLPESL